MNRYDQYASSCSGHLDQFVSDDRLSDEIHTNGYTQIHTDEQTHTHKLTPYKHLHARKRHTAYIHPHTHTHSRTSAYNQTHTSPTHTDPYAFYLSRLSLPHAHSSAPYVCSFNLSKLFPCGVIRSYNFPSSFLLNLYFSLLVLTSLTCGVFRSFYSAGGLEFLSSSDPSQCFVQSVLGNLRRMHLCLSNAPAHTCGIHFRLLSHFLSQTGKTQRAGQLCSRCRRYRLLCYGL